MMTATEHRRALGLGSKPSLVAYIRSQGIECTESEQLTAKWIDGLADQTILNVINIMKNSDKGKGM